MSAHLDRINALDQYKEILELLTPHELVIVALRLDGMNDADISGATGLTRACIGARAARAQKRILGRYPELRGRYQALEQESELPPMQQAALDAVTVLEQSGLVTARMVAEFIGWEYTAVMNTLRRCLKNEVLFRGTDIQLGSRHLSHTWRTTGEVPRDA